MFSGLIGREVTQAGQHPIPAREAWIDFADLDRVRTYMNVTRSCLRVTMRDSPYREVDVLASRELNHQSKSNHIKLLTAPESIATWKAALFDTWGAMSTFSSCMASFTTAL